MKELWLGSATKYKMTVTFLSAYLKGHNQMCRHLITIMSSVKIQTLSMEFSFPLKSLSWLNLKPQSFQSGIFFLSLKHKKLEKTERRWGKQKTITPHSVFWIHKRKKAMTTVWKCVHQSWSYTIFSSRRADARSGHRWFLYRERRRGHKTEASQRQIHSAELQSGFSFCILDGAALSINMQIITLHIQALHNNKSLWIVEVHTRS